MVKRILRFLGIAGILGFGIASAYAFSFGEFFGMEQKETPVTTSRVWLYETQQHHIYMQPFAGREYQGQHPSLCR